MAGGILSAVGGLTQECRMALMFSVLLILAGAVPVLLFAGLIAWQLVSLFTGGGWVPLPALLLFTDHSFGFVPDLTWIWRAGADSPQPIIWVLSRVHFALLPALAGLAVMAAGVRRILAQRAAIRAKRERHDDRLRRVHDYQREDRSPDAFDGRREPFISSLTVLGVAEKNPAQRGARAG
jgi:hypothetical protein